MDALPDINNRAAFRPPRALKPVDPPSGPKGVAIIHDETLEGIVDMSSPMYQSIRLRERGFKDSYLWKSLPLTWKLGVPLYFKVLTGGSPLPMSNKSLELLSIDCDPESEYFGEPSRMMEEVVLVARQDGKDLLPQQMRAVIAFLDAELMPLVLYGIHKDDEDETGGESNAAGGQSEPHVAQGTVQDGLLEQELQESSSDSAAEDHLDTSSTAAQADKVTEQEAVDALSQITPERFASFFESYRSEKVKEDPTWGLVRCPTETTSTCEKCGIGDGADGEALELCGGCRRVLYCSKVCQKADWAVQQSACKRMVWKMSKRPSMKDVYE